MPAASLIPFTLELRPSLPTISGSKDYEQWREQLERIDLLLSPIEQRLTRELLGPWLKANPEASARAQVKFQRTVLLAIRCNVARALTQLDYRQLSAYLADSRLLQWFCRLELMDGIKAPSKSTLQRLDSLIEETHISAQIRLWLAELANPTTSQITRDPLDFDTVFMDTTCLRTNIHFPVDWVLLRDATRTLIKAILVIRSHGLHHRMPEPESFISDMNRLSIQMTHARGSTEAKKERKRVLRAMKKVVKVVEEHARRYQGLLLENWKTETDLSEKEVKQIVSRIQGVVEQLPQAVKQAHERIIGERQVNNADKILSLYERDTQVMVRRKAGADVEFGNKLFLSETVQGLIADWELHRDDVPSDTRLLKPSVERTEKQLNIKIKAAVTDRGFDSQENRLFLKREDIFDAMCPRDPALLKERMEGEEFRALQKRRSQTEGRIGIFKNVFLGRPMRAKGFENRKRSLAWAVLAHNLWVVVRMEWKEEALTPQSKAA